MRSRTTLDVHRVSERKLQQPRQAPKCKHTHSDSKTLFCNAALLLLLAQTLLFGLSQTNTRMALAHTNNLSKAQNTSEAFQKACN